MSPLRLVPRFVSLVLLGATAALAQTGAVTPQRPARTVESVRPLAKVKEDAARVDALLERSLKLKFQEPQPDADDATFVRRAYLSIVGRIPTLKETEAFFADQAADKRDRLVDRLLDSPGRTSHFANFWFDLFRVKSRQRQLSGEPFAHWLREAVQQDLPYDDLVRAMLTAEGAAHAAGNGATGLLLRDQNMPHDAMANTLRVFLGTRLECAQCHNHPFQHWTQREFFEMAAFFGGLRFRDDAFTPNLAGIRTKLAEADERTRTQARQLLQRMSQGLDGSGTGAEKLPADYKYDDAKPGTPVAASTLFGKEVKLKPPAKPNTEGRRPRGPRQREQAPEIGSRGALADWLTSPKNPLFAKVMANRMWARTFGGGLVEPVDDWQENTAPVHPELLLHLTRLLVELDFDLRQFERVLVHTRLFGRQCEPEAAPGQPFLSRGPALRRFSAEQMWDSLLTLVFDDVDDRLRAMDARAKEVYEQYEQVKNADADQLLAMAQQRPGQQAMQMAQQRAEDTRRQLAADQALQQRARPLLQELARARRQGDQAKVQDLAMQLQQLGLPLGQRAARGREGDLLRASDLAQPAPPSHLLRQFGQSDRETIDAASTAATVPQVLTLLNGFLDQRVLEGQSALRRDLEIAADGERRVRVAFLTTLNREPTAAELQEWRKAIAIDGPNAIKDLVWVLCNSHEFRFVR